LAAPAGLAYRRDGGRPDQADSGEGTAAPPRTEREVVMTAHDSSHHAERRDIGEATLEQLRADVTHLAHNLVTAPLLTMFREQRRPSLAAPPLPLRMPGQLEAQTCHARAVSITVA